MGKNDEGGATEGRVIQKLEVDRKTARKQGGGARSQGTKGKARKGREMPALVYKVKGLFDVYIIPQV